MKIFAAVADGSVIIFKRNQGNMNAWIINPMFCIYSFLNPGTLLSYFSLQNQPEGHENREKLSPTKEALDC